MASSSSSSATFASHIPAPPMVTSPFPNFPSMPTGFLRMQLTPTNFLSWRAQIMPLLRSQSLVKFIDGSFPPPPSTLPSDSTPPSDPIPNPAYQTWFAQDQYLMSLLISSLREDVVPMIFDATTSREIWLSLEQAFASPSMTRMIQLHLSLHELNQKDRSVSDYLYGAKAIADELAAAGRPVDTADFNVFIFKGLRPELQTIIPTIAARPSPATFNELLSMLLSHDILTTNFQNMSLSASPLVSPASNGLLPTPTVNLSQRHNTSTPNHQNRGGNSYNGNKQIQIPRKSKSAK